MNKEFITVVVNQVINILTVFMLTKLMAENFSFVEIAAYSIITIAQNLNVQLLGGPLTAYIGRFYRLRQKISEYYKVKKFLTIAQLVLILTSVIFLLIYIDFRILNDNFAAAQLVISLYISLFIFQLCLIATLECQRLRIKSLFGQLLDSIVRIFLFFTLLYLDKFDIMNIILVGAFSLLFSNCLLLFYAIQAHKTDPLSDYVRSDITSAEYSRSFLIKFIQPIIFWGLLGWAYQSINRISLNEFATDKELAIYYVYYQLFFIPSSLFFSIISKYGAPIFREVNDTKGFYAYIKLEKQLVNRVIFIILLGLMITSFILYFHHEFVINLVSSAAYVGNFYIYFVFIVSGICTGFASFLSLFFNITFNNNIFLRVSIFTSAVAICIGPVFVFYSGLHGAAICLLTHSVLLLGYTCWERKKLIQCY